jgi:hypothetical protein
MLKRDRVNKKQNVLKKLIQERGYIVIWQRVGEHVYRVGEVVPGLGRENIKLGQPFAVIAVTDSKDFIAQQKRSKELAPELWGNDDIERWKLSPTTHVFLRVSTD